MLSSDVDLPEWAEPLFEAHRYKSLWGGRGAAKSWTVATSLLILAMQQPLRILCARELQNSIKDSVHRLLADRIQQFDWPYDTTRDEIRGANGSLFLFEGIRHNVAKIKSTEGIDICWVEEAQAISEESWQTLIPTIRKPSSEIWLTWNTSDEEAPTYKRFVAKPPPGSWTRRVGWHENPWISPELIKEKDYLYSVDPVAAAHVWGGEPLRFTSAQVLRGRYVVEPFEPKPEWNGPYFGADWGFAADPTTLIRCWVHERTLYVEHEAYGVGVDLDDTPELFDHVPEGRKHTVRADNSRPETISHMHRHGYRNIIGCTKWPGSVEDGVEHLRSYEKIVIHPRCTHAAEEARLWSYKTDKLTGDVLPVLVDKHDHCWDATRYALELIIQAGRPNRPKEPEKKKRDVWAKAFQGGSGETWKRT